MTGVSPIIRPWTNYWGKPWLRLIASSQHGLVHGAAMKGQYIIILPRSRSGFRGIEMTLYVYVCMCVRLMKTSVCNISVIYMANNTKFGMWTPIVLQRKPLTYLGVTWRQSMSHAKV